LNQNRNKEIKNETEPEPEKLYQTQESAQEDKIGEFIFLKIFIFIYI